MKASDLLQKYRSFQGDEYKAEELDNKNGTKAKVLPTEGEASILGIPDQETVDYGEKKENQDSNSSRKKKRKRKGLESSIDMTRLLKIEEGVSREGTL